MSYMDLCSPLNDDISPPVTPPPSGFHAASPQPARPTQRLRSSSYHDPTFITNSSQLATVFNDWQLEQIRSIKTTFQQLTAQQKHFFLHEILSCCDNSQLGFISSYISPKLKIDFLRELPIEISLHILSFVDDPKTLSRASCVSTFWNSLLKDETTWKRLCLSHQFPRRNSSITGGSLMGPPIRRLKFSYRDYFKRRYNIESNWHHGGKVTTFFDSTETGLITSLQFDDEVIVVGCDNHMIEVFDVNSGKKLRTLKGHLGGVWALQFKGGEIFDKERILVSGGCDRDIRVWNLDTGKEIHVLRGHTSTVRCLKMINKQIAVTGSRDTTLRVWDIERGVCKHVLIGHQASVRCLDANNDIVVSGSYDSTARIWNMHTGECLHVLAGHYSQIYAIAFDGEKVVTGSLDSNIRLWNVADGHCLATLLGHTSLVGQLQLSGSTLVSGGSDGVLRIWDMETYECIHRLAAHDNSVTCLQFDDKRMLSGGNDGRVKLWDMKTGHLIRCFTAPAKTIWRLSFTDRKAVVVMQRSGSNDSQPHTHHIPNNATTQDGEEHTVMEIHDFDSDIVSAIEEEEVDGDMAIDEIDGEYEKVECPDVDPRRIPARNGRTIDKQFADAMSAAST